MPKTGVSVGVTFLGLSGLLLAGCFGSNSTATVSSPRELIVTSTTNEFNRNDFEQSLEEQRREDRVYEVDPDGGSDDSLDLERDNEFDTREMSSAIFEERRDDRSSVVIEQSSSESSFNYDAFMAQMTELRAQQRAGTYYRSSSSANASSTRSSNSIQDLPKYPLDTVFQRSSRSSSSSYSGGSFLTRSSNSSVSSRSSSSARSGSSLSSTASSQSSGPAECGDGRDNDGDGTIDADDPQCHSDGNATYLPSYDYRFRSESQFLSALTSSSLSSMSSTVFSRSSSLSSVNTIHSASNPCADRSVIPALGDNALTGNEGTTVPYLINGGCPVTGAILPAWGGNSSTVFGSLAEYPPVFKPV
jgi:hypothetical protein